MRHNRAPCSWSTPSTTDRWNDFAGPRHCRHSEVCSDGRRSRHRRQRLFREAAAGRSRPHGLGHWPAEVGLGYRGGPAADCRLTATAAVRHGKHHDTPPASPLNTSAYCHSARHARCYWPTQSAPRSDRHDADPRAARGARARWASSRRAGHQLERVCGDAAAPRLRCAGLGYRPSSVGAAPLDKQGEPSALNSLTCRVRDRTHKRESPPPSWLPGTEENGLTLTT